MIGGKAINWYCAACDERIVQVDFAEQVRAEERERIVKALEVYELGMDYIDIELAILIVQGNNLQDAIAIVRGDA